MRVITTETTVYTFDELDDRAKERALENVSSLLGVDTEDISDTIVYGFAEALKTPGWDTFGEGDFPGIDGVKLAEWDMGRGQSVTFKGTLDRDNAPALPWVDGMVDVVLESIDYGRMYVREDYEITPTAAKTATMVEAVESALHVAWKAGRTQMDYAQSEENAKAWIEDNEREFTEEGDL